MTKDVVLYRKLVRLSAKAVMGVKYAGRPARSQPTQADLRYARAALAVVLRILARESTSVDQLRALASGKFDSYVGDDLVAEGTARKLTPAEEELREIRERYAAGGVSQMALSREYGLSPTMVSKIVRGLDL